MSNYKRLKKLFEAYSREDNALLYPQVERNYDLLSRIRLQNKNLTDNEQEELLGLVSPNLTKKRYLNSGLTLLELFKEHYETLKSVDPAHKARDVEEANRLDNFFVLVGNTKRRRTLTIFAAAMATVGFMATLVITGLLSLWMASAVFMPAFGLVFTLSMALLSWRKLAKNYKNAVSRVLLDSFLLLAQNALNIAAYGLLIASAVTMNPVAAILFVVASVVDLFADLIRLRLNAKRNNLQDDPYTKIRQAQERKKLIKQSIVDTVISAAMVAIMVVWCFMPGSFLLTAGLLVAMGLVFAAKAIAKSVIESKAHKATQAALNEQEAIDAKAGCDMDPADKPREVEGRLSREVEGRLSPEVEGRLSPEVRVVEPGLPRSRSFNSFFQPKSKPQDEQGSPDRAASCDDRTRVFSPTAYPTPPGFLAGCQR